MFGTADVKKKLLAFIDERILDGQGKDLQETDPLFELGIIDSLSLVLLRNFIKAELAVEIADEQVLPKHFKDVKSIAQLVTASVAVPS